MKEIMTNDVIPFNKPYMTGKELFYIAKAKFNNMLSGDGAFTKDCHCWLEKNTSCNKALLTHSCTAALEMSALLLDIKPGDEIIMPSYTFVSTANAFVLRGGIPVFIDIHEDTLNINENLIESVISKNTKAIVPVHYAGVACEMDEILSIARNNKINVVEDAAQGIMSTYKGNPLGSIGDLGAYSFHETKNVISGEGGVLLINDDSLIERAEIIREKGTNRSQFFQGKVDKYSWQEAGSSYLPGELISAFLWAQLESADKITEKRLSIWNSYHMKLAELEKKEYLRRPVVPSHSVHNAHMYYILLPNASTRNKLMMYLNKKNIDTVFHYIPLHSSPGGQKYARVSGNLNVTNKTSETILRLPLWVEMNEDIVERVCAEIENFFLNKFLTKTSKS